FLHFYTPLFWYSVFLLFMFFFFSSRRRHTRSKRDWSSDVCSSDLHSYQEHPRHLLIHLFSSYFLHLRSNFFILFNIPLLLKDKHKTLKYQLFTLRKTFQTSKRLTFVNLSHDILRFQALQIGRAHV